MTSSIARRNYVFNTGGPANGNIALMLSSNNSFMFSNDATIIGPTTLSNTLMVSGDVKANSNMYIMKSLGIGTSNPYETVDIIGNTRVTGTFVSSGACVIRKAPGQVNTSNIFSFYEVNGIRNVESDLYLQSSNDVIIKSTDTPVAYFKRNTIGFYGNVGIGISNSQYPLHVTGQSNNVSIFSQFGVTQFSDISLKTDIIRIQNALHTVMQLHGYSYYRIDGDTNKRTFGLIAQEVKEVIPEVVHSVIHTNNDDILSISYTDLIALLIEAIKDIKQEKDNEIRELQKRICDIEKRICE